MITTRAAALAVATTMLATLGAHAGTTVSNGVASQPAQESRFVRPESLPQGFIILVEDVARTARRDVPIYFAGSINQWAAEDPQWQLEPRSDGRWQLEITPERMGGLNPQQMQFKFTMGGWDREELTEDGGVPGNRSLPMVDLATLDPGEQPIFELVVPQFRERGEAQSLRVGTYRDLDVTGRVVRMQVAGGSGSAAGVMRDLQIWLPEGVEPNGDHGGRTYPVLYMFDGQNLFDGEDDGPAEWGMDETLSALIAEGVIEPMIVVGIPNSGGARIEEYLPPSASGDRTIGPGMTASGDAHVGWVLREVMPRVQSVLPVATERDRVAIGGASLGGVMALYAASAHPELIGRVLAESPTTLLRGNELGGTPVPGGRWRLERVLGTLDGVPDRVFLARGARESRPDAPASQARNREGVHNTRRVAAMLTERGADVTLVIDPDGLHNEATWARRLPDALRALFAN